MTRDTPPRLAPRTAAALLMAVAADCAHPQVATERRARDPLADAARAVLAAGCARPLPSPPVPPRPQAARDGPADVVVFTAHPDDEAMYAGGTIRRLTDAGRRVALVPMSHGEGGRLLEPGPDGGIVERRDYPRSHVIAVRDAEIARAAALARVELAFVNPASADADYGFTTSCEQALSHWDASLAGGLRGVLARMVVELRARRPAVVLTLDPRDDPQASHHGHHKAVGVLAELATRLAAEPTVAVGGAPHVVREVWSFAPLDAPYDLAVPVDPNVRRELLAAYASQFRAEDLDGAVARRPAETFVRRWRVPDDGAPPTAGSVLEALLAGGRTP